jgi:hypothetical protein
VAVGGDTARSFGQQDRGYAAAAVAGGHVDLLHLVVGDHHEARDLAVDLGHRCVGPAGCGPRHERLRRPDRDQFRGHVPHVPVGPAVAPDRGDRGDIVGPGLA